VDKAYQPILAWLDKEFPSAVYPSEHWPKDDLLAHFHVRLGEVAVVELEVGHQQVHHADRQHRIRERAGCSNAQRRGTDGRLALRDARVALERLGDERVQTRIALDGGRPGRRLLRCDRARRADQPGEQQQLSGFHASPHELVPGVAAGADASLARRVRTHCT